MQQICRITNQPFVISESELDYCNRNEIPTPTLSPRERLREVLIRRNRVHLFNATCAVSKKKVLSMFPPESGHVVYDCSVWFSDQWDATSYGRPYDFNRPFFDQWAELFRTVPQANLAVVYASLDNSDFANGITGGKNLYLVFSSSFCSDSLFCKSLWRSSHTVDSTFVRDSEQCYECVDVGNCYGVKYSKHCTNCSDSAFLSNCLGCSNCYGCVNLERKQYHFFNQKLTKVEYERRLAEIDLGSYAVVQREKTRFAEFAEKFPVRAYFGLRNQNSTGNFINGNKNAANCYFVSNAEDVENCINLDKVKNCFSVVAFGNNSELIYNSCTVGDNAYNIRFSFDCWMGVRDLEYCALCLNGCTDCFGCVGLKRQSYCILNKQYSKSEYFELLPRIKSQMRAIGEYGKFFPKESSTFAYNIAETDDYFRLDRDAALGLGYAWREDDLTPATESSPIPDHIDDVTDEHIKRVYRCELTGKPYRLVRAELDFYRTHRIPPPHIAPLERIKSRLGFFEINPTRLQQCATCNSEFATARSLAGSAPMLCETCFQESIE